MDALIVEIVGRSDMQIRDRLAEYLNTLSEVGVEVDILIACANEFIREFGDHDKRYSGC